MGSAGQWGRGALTGRSAVSAGEGRERVGWGFLPGGLGGLDPGGLARAGSVRLG